MHRHVDTHPCSVKKGLDTALNKAVAWITEVGNTVEGRQGQPTANARGPAPRSDGYMPYGGYVAGNQVRFCFLSVPILRIALRSISHVPSNSTKLLATPDSYKPTCSIVAWYYVDISFAPVSILVCNSAVHTFENRAPEERTILAEHRSSSCGSA